VWDLLFIVLIIVFLLLSLALVAVCNRLKEH
jgi:hypothetical protein